MRAPRPALRLALVLVALVLVALPHLLQAQAVPVTGVFPVDLPSAGCHTESFDPYALFSYPGRGFLVTLDWSGENCTSLPPEVGVGFIFSEAGEPDGTFFLSPPRSQPYSLVDYPVAIPGGNGGFIGFWEQYQLDRTDILFQRFGPDARPVDRVRFLKKSRPDIWRWLLGTDTNAHGQYALAVYEQNDATGHSTLWIRAFHPAGEPASPEVRLGTVEFGSASVAIDQKGRLSALWSDEGQNRINYQRFASDGTALTAPIPIAAFSSDIAFTSQPGGSFVFAWSAEKDGRVRIRHFDADGRPLGESIEIAPGEEVLLSAADAHGNFAAAWSGADGAMYVQLMNHLLVPQGSPIIVWPARDWLTANFDLTDSGRLLVLWAEEDRDPPSPSTTPVFGQVWQALRDADSCVRRGGQFLCDTAGDGGAPEEAMAFGSGDPREIPFLADWDGDGRTDPCLYRGRQFFCDTAHDGGLAEARTLDVGLPGDVPLLGDLDGDGRADPCVRRGVAFLCDRARDGGSKDLKIPFGLRSDLPLLGDPDGDGRDDPCVYRGGLFLCDTGHDGIAAELRLDLGSALSASALQAPLLGDVDGDGRDEACLWSSGHLICGVFGPRGGRPLRLLERAFGTRGDIPLLGDLDAF